MIRAYTVTKAGALEQISDQNKIIESFRDTATPTWIDIDNAMQADFDFLEKQLGFHALTVEDIIHQNQRPKIDDYETYCFITVRAPVEGDVGKTIQLNIYLGKSFVVTVSPAQLKGIDTVLDRCKKNPHILLKGHDFLVYSILDMLVDEFFLLIYEIDNKLDRIEDRIFKGYSADLMNTLFRLKRQLASLRHLVWPMRDILNNLARRDFEYVKPKNTVYYRDVYDHLVRMTDMIDNSRDILTSAMEAYLSVLSNSINTVMKKLTAATIILMIPTLIASIYGMNFQYMWPALDVSTSFYGVMAVMGLSIVVLFGYFKWRDWI